MLFDIPTQPFGEILGKSQILGRDVQFELFPRSVARVFGLHEHLGLRLFGAVFLNTGTGSHPGMFHGLVEGSLHESVDGDARLGGDVCNVPVGIRGNADVEGAGVAFFGLYSMFFAENKIIINSLMECCCKFLNRFSFIGNQIRNTLKRSEEYFIKSIIRSRFCHCATEPI